ncbi:MAG: class I SAM-dependent methyltransferase, partial [Ignavibacteria bacterium]
LPANKFDLIMFADVLEHLIDPEYVLKELKNKLKPGGEIIASIPNIRHWSIFRQLLEGNWNYAEHGLLDKTHLRFFTRKTMISLFENAGYHAEVIGSQKVGNFEIPDNVMEMLNSAGLDVSTLRDEINVFQYFLRATLGKNAIFVPSQLFDQNMIAKLQSLSPNIKSNLKIFLLYKIPTPTVEFIKSLDEEKEGIGAVHVDEVKFDNYNQIGIITSPSFGIQDFETKFSITETVSANQNFLVFNGKNLPDTEIQNLIRFVQ